jgi:hypothetical protein
MQDMKIMEGINQPKSGSVMAQSLVTIVSRKAQFPPGTTEADAYYVTKHSCYHTAEFCPMLDDWRIETDY